MWKRTGTHQVFISYSHDSESHRSLVLELADRLRGDGVDAWLDRYELAPGEGWPRWMQRQINAAEFVLVVCTDTYRRRFDGEEECGKGLGATYEGLVATQVLYETAANNKFIPVLLPGGSNVDVPLVLRPFTVFDLPKEFAALYGYLTNQPPIRPSPVGTRKRVGSKRRRISKRRVRSRGLPQDDPALRAFINEALIPIADAVRSSRQETNESRLVRPTDAEVRDISPSFRKLVRELKRHGLAEFMVIVQAALAALVDRAWRGRRDR